MSGLYWRKESDPPELAEPLRQAPEITRGFRETGRYCFSAGSSGRALYIDDERLEGQGSEWVWRPGFYAGKVTAELVHADGSCSSYVLEVRPDARKVGVDPFRRMISELLTLDPTLILGNEPAQTGVLAEGEDEDYRIQFARIRRYASQLLHALDQLCSQPVQDLLHERRTVPLNSARNIDRRTVLAALRHTESAAFFSGDPERAGQVVLDVPSYRLHSDIPANRCIAAAVHAVRRRLVHVTSIMERAAHSEIIGETRTALAGRWPRREAMLTDFRQSLERCLRREPLSSVTRLEISAAGLNAVSAHPVYARIYQIVRKILNGHFGRRIEDEDEDSVWLSPTWEIYERWCFARMRQHLIERLSEVRWSFPRRHPSSSLAAAVGVGNDGNEYTLLLQPRFPAGDLRAQGGNQSISGERRPDIVYTERTAAARRFLVLDAKYRSERSSLLEAMGSAHIYRDSLRWHGQRPDGAYLLAPRASEVAWLADPDFQARERCGVLELTPEDDGPGKVYEILNPEAGPERMKADSI